MSSRHPTATVSRGSSIAASAAFGVLAAALGYLVTYLLVVSEVRDELGGDVAEWMGVAWYYYNAHLVDIDASGSLGGISGSETVNFVAESSSTTASVLYIVPPLVLFGAGALLAYHFGARDLGAAAAVGAPVSIGYVVLLGLGALVAESSFEGTFFGAEATSSMAPAPVPAVVLAAIYSLVFATAGAVLVSVLADDR
ncbi:MAG: hypothetical protein ACQETI_13915 [Halobacteriota archaeon]